MTLYVLRHGQTVWNLEGRFQGQQDSPLTELGVNQATRLAESLEAIGSSRLFSSPLGRARNTAAVVAKKIGIAVETDTRLKECHFGHCEGLTRPEMESRFPGLWAVRTEDRWGFRWPGGESFKDLMTRAGSFLKERKDALASGDVLIVAHETINRALIGSAVGLRTADILDLAHPNHVIYRIRKGDVSFLDTTAPSGQWRAGILRRSR